MSSLVIVAIPREDDLVWKISTEKVPHLTLMYLGEVEDANHAGRMAEFVQHALNVNEHGPFYLEVDRRGELGEDKADVLFFEGGWDAKWIKSLRGQLLKQNDIRSAFEAQDQFPDWVPHLTLGYPDDPAKPVPDDRRIYSVEFDRIAVWIGDYEGPEFRLKWPERDDTNEMAIAYSDIGKSTVEELLHYGVKGMQWGKRKEPSVIERPKTNLTRNQQIGVGAAVAVPGIATLGNPLSMLAGFGVANLHKGTRENLSKDRAQDKAFRADKAWEKTFKKDKKYMDVHNDMADHMNSWLPSHNKKYDGVDLTKNPAKMKEYEDGYFKEQNASFARSYSKVYGSSPSGKYKVSVIPGTDKVVLHNVKVAPDEFKHAAEEEEPLMTFRLTQDPKTWYILKVEPVSESMAQTAELGEQFIEHFGTKGMKWGVRKEQLKSGAKAVGRGLNAVGTAVADADHEKAVEDGRARQTIVNKANAAFHRTDLPAIKAKPEYQEAKKLTNRLRHPKDPATKKYRKEVKDAYIKRLEEAANSETNFSGNRQYTIRERGWELPKQGGDLPTSKNVWTVSSRAIQHGADSFEGETSLEVIMDDDGFITELKPIDPVELMVHSIETGEEFILEHFGIKGMRWGRRSDRPAPEAVTPTATSRVPHGEKRKTKVEVEGGENHPAHQDAIKVAEAQAKLKKSGTKALSNKELQEVANRIQLEERVSLLTASSGRKFVRKHLTNQSDALARAGLQEAVKTGPTTARKVRSGATTLGRIAAMPV